MKTHLYYLTQWNTDSSPKDSYLIMMRMRDLESREAYMHERRITAKKLKKQQSKHKRSQSTSSFQTPAHSDGNWSEANRRYSSGGPYLTLNQANVQTTSVPTSPALSLARLHPTIAESDIDSDVFSTG